MGIGLRLFHYLRDPSVWHDEAALIVNVLGKSFAGLLGPLLCAEAAPPLFLWVERLAVLALGESTYALRLLPLLVSCAALLLLVPVARRVLSPRAVPWALLLFACSDRLLWHACEAKPYALDALVALGMIAFYRSTRAWRLGWQLGCSMLLAPVVIFLVYPGCFLYGGLLLVLLPDVWRDGLARTWLGYGGLALTVFAAFALLTLGPVHAQRCGAMDQCWETYFPHWDRAWTVPGWALVASAEVIDYCCRPIGAGFIVLAAAGAVGLWRRRERSLLALFLVPVGLALIASGLHAYPYGGARVMVYAAPAVVLLVAEGAAAALAWLRTWNRSAAVALGAVLLAPLGQSLYRAAVPWPRADYRGAAAYVLAQFQPADALIANSWEALYYFRRRGPAFRSPADPGYPEAARVWVVVTGAVPPPEREQIRDALAPGAWRTTARREFAGTSVFLLEPAACAPSGSHGRRPTGNQGRHISPFEAAVDVDDHDVGGAAVEHRQQRRQAPQGGPVADARGHRDYRAIDQAADHAGQRPVHPRDDHDGIRAAELVPVP
jgi:hypothetical protein